MRQIAENAGRDGAVVSGKLLEAEDATLGFNAQTEEYENLVKAGVIDPTKVVRTALQNAASVAGLLITTEATMTRCRRTSRQCRWAMARTAEWAEWTSKSSRQHQSEGPGTLPAPLFCAMIVEHASASLS